MFIEADKKITPFCFGKATFWLRYDNRAFLNIEKEGFEPLNILKSEGNPKAVRSFLVNGLSDFGKASGYSREEIKDIANALMTAEGFGDVLIATIALAVVNALPVAPIGMKKPDKEGKSDITSLMTCFCDIMGKSEEEFWSSTLREVHERWERYGAATGKIKPVEEFREFDDD